MIRADDRIIWGSSTGRDWEFFTSPLRPDQIWDPPSLLSNGYQGLFTWGSSGREVKLTTHLYLLPRSRMCGAITLMPQYAFKTRCSDKRAQGQLYLLTCSNLDTTSTWNAFLYDMRVYSKVFGLAAWSENCKWYSSLPLSAVVSLFYESV
jgi:hypothetical protein